MSQENLEAVRSEISLGKQIARLISNIFRGYGHVKKREDDHVLRRTSDGVGRSETTGRPNRHGSDVWMRI